MAFTKFQYSSQVKRRENSSSFTIIRSLFSSSGQSLEGVRVDMNGTLVIYRVGPSNKGAYRCSATNSLGMRYKTINLDIILVPPKLRYNRAIAYADLGGTIEIDCNSTGVPTPIVSWILPSGEVKLNVLSDII